MKYELSAENGRDQFIQKIEKMSGQNISLCYQCGKCSAGCPICQDMDAAPNQVIRYIQLGLKDQALSTRTIWLCASCQTCSTRCPQQIDLARVMDSLRILYQQEEAPKGVSVKEFGQRIYHSLLDGLQMDVRSNVRAFSTLFLKMVRYYGRLFETGLIYNYNINSGFLLDNVLKGPVMLMKAKINLIPEEVNRREKVERIFSKIEQMEREER